MLGALSVLQSTLKTTGGAGSIYSRRVVFLALAGEPWGYMGSRRLLYEAYTGSNNTAGLDLSLIEKVPTVLDKSGSMNHTFITFIEHDLLCHIRRYMYSEILLQLAFACW
eukprot:GHUV01053036.1.p1 GENE.GHUV01053036.1~~GHUV01053036.1.p1  ORF type:complete len:110 (-),score=22.16 GHUV01053036.1:102-431(-)